MNAEEMVRELRRVQEQTKNDFVGTGRPVITLMCADCASLIEFLQRENADLKAQLVQKMQQLEKAIEDVPHECLYCAKRCGWDVCKEAAFISDGAICLNWKYMGLEAES